MTIPGDRDHLAQQRAGLLRFAAGARVPLGFGPLRADGSVDVDRPVELYVTCRMTHVAAVAAIVAEPPAVAGPDVGSLRALAEHGVAALTGPLRDDEHGGWFAAVDGDGPAVTTKEAYGHSFVVLAAASAVQAGVEGAGALLDDAVALVVDRFWQDDVGMLVDRWDRTWSRLDPYRGVNANMHAVEAFLAAGDATGDRSWYDRADRVAARVVRCAHDNDWRVPEHFDADWRPMLGFNRERPADRFRPYGATIGHALEWSRLLLGIDEALGRVGAASATPVAVALYDRAVEDGWAVDGAEGFVYTTDWDGAPVVRHRMHWVLAEAVAAAEMLHRETGDARFADDARRWWSYADRHLVDHERGSWHHELDPANRPSSTVWSGKPDVYHAYQAALLPSLPAAPSVAAAARLAADGRAGLSG